MRAKVQFLLGDQPRVIEDIDPTMTVLEYLRGPGHRTGTKEGCAEGDCGACTVVLAESNENGEGLNYRAVNSCIQFVPSLDGKQLITVEDLKAKNGQLHPVQEAMCSAEASQCGFCTPGIVMSLFAMDRNTSTDALEEGATNDHIKDTLAGNLCRCTGYGPILTAAGSIRKDSDDKFSAAEGSVLEQLKTYAADEMMGLRTPKQSYYAPRTIAELNGLLSDMPHAQIIAGLTDVGLWVTKQHRELSSLISISAIAELKEISITEKHIDIGAGVTLSEAHETLASYYPDFDEFIRRFASVQIRNAGTVGGNIANGSPIGDLPPALIALNATLVLRKDESTREIPLEEFFIEYGKQDRQLGEFVERVLVPLPRDDEAFACYKLSKRFEQDISAVCAAFRVRVEDGQVSEVRVAFGGMAGTPKRARSCEAAMFGQPWTEATVRNAMASLNGDFTPMSDMRSSAAYRSMAARNLLMKFYLETTDQAPEQRVSEMTGGRHGHIG